MNRCLTEGRKAFLERVAGIEAGTECERLAPLLSRLADGEATADDLTKLRPHIRTCLSCRAALREYRGAPATAAALVPAAAFVASDRPALLDAPARLLEGVTAWTQKAQTAVEMASAQKVAAVAASTAVLGGGAAVTVQQVERHPAPAKRIARVERERPKPPAPAPTAAAPPAAAYAPPPAAPPQPSAAERRAREAKRKTPPAQQEFEPAWAAGEPEPAETTATASAAAAPSSPAPAPAPTRSGGGAEEFAP